MFRIAICDDASIDRMILAKFASIYCDAHCLKSQIQTFSSAEELLACSHSWDVLLLDIYMEGKSGLEVAKIFRQSHSDIKIIFISSSREHALDGYEFQAIHYLVKPVSYETFAKALDRCAVDYIDAQRYLEVISMKILVRIPLNDIRYVEVYDKASIIHTGSSSIKTYQALNDIHEQLGGIPFLRCHRSYIVNLNHVVRMETGSFVMDTQEQVPIPRAKRMEMRQIFSDYQFKIGQA